MRFHKVMWWAGKKAVKDRDVVDRLAIIHFLSIPIAMIAGGLAVSLSYAGLEGVIQFLLVSAIVIPPTGVLSIIVGGYVGWRSVDEKDELYEELRQWNEVTG